MGAVAVGGFEEWVGGDPAARLEELARSRGALRRVLAGLCAAFVEGKCWDALGYVRVGDHARERLGLSGRSVHDLARVGRELPRLPRIEAALVSGALPWSKARLLARFVTEGDEAQWIARARRLSVRELERQVRAVDRGALEAGGLALDEDGGGLEPVETVGLRAGSKLAFQWLYTRRWAARVAGEPVAPGTALEMVTAEALSALPGGVEVEDSAGEVRRLRFPTFSKLASVCTHTLPEADGGLEDAEPPSSAVLPAFLEPVLAGAGRADARELDRRLRRVVRLEQRLDAQLAPLLREVPCLASTAREKLGMSPRKARALLRLERVGDACPELRAAFRDGAISWVQAQALVPLLLEAAGDWATAWLEFARQVTVRRLEDAVGRALVERQTCARPRDAIDDVPLRPLRITAPRDVARLFRAVLCTLRKATEARTGRLPSEAEAFGAMLEHALTSWGVDARRPRRFAVFERDGWRCTVPGCTSHRNLHAHHIRFRSAGGADAPENLTTLCAAHHQRHVHAGVVRIRGRAPHALEFELPLGRYRSGDVVAFTAQS